MMSLLAVLEGEQRTERNMFHLSQGFETSNAADELRIGCKTQSDSSYIMAPTKRLSEKVIRLSFFF
jgi:hypothetical protein